MDFSIFLARVMGLYFLIISFAVLINRKRFLSIIAAILKNEALQQVLGIFILIIGILLITSHNVWEPSWPILITLVGWITFIKGILNVVFPSVANTISQPFIRSKKAFFYSAFINVILGIFFCYYGYF